MKLFFAATAMLALTGCNNADKTETTNASMPGAYKMLSQSLKSSKLDTTTNSLQQLKMYSADYMMYANFNPADSISSFGIGTYTADKDTVTENVIYNASDSSKSDSPGSFKLAIEKTDKGYKQVISDLQMQSGEKMKLTEDYESIGTTVASTLDGAWKITKAYYVNGKDTSKNDAVQYKMYADGHFIFGHTYSDSAKKTHTGMGYGTFAMTGNKSKETVLVSTYYQIRNQSVDLDIEMNGNDAYTQTITNKDGSKSVEMYQRLKK